MKLEVFIHLKGLFFPHLAVEAPCLFFERIVQQTLGTVVLTVDGVEYEHTTFRTESYGAGGAHRPDAVRFSDTPQVDAFRRDFSVNALYESVSDGTLVDPTGGVKDLERRVLRTTTADPAQILRDDGLRILPYQTFVFHEMPPTLSDKGY